MGMTIRKCVPHKNGYTRCSNAGGSACKYITSRLHLLSNLFTCHEIQPNINISYSKLESQTVTGKRVPQRELSALSAVL